MKRKEDRLVVNVKLLKSETIKRGFKDRDVAEKALNITVQAYNKKLRFESKFSTNDAMKIIDFLGIKDKNLKADIFLA